MGINDLIINRKLVVCKELNKIINSAILNENLQNILGLDCFIRHGSQYRNQKMKKLH